MLNDILLSSSYQVTSTGLPGLYHFIYKNSIGQYTSPSIETMYRGELGIEK